MISPQKVLFATGSNISTASDWNVEMAVVKGVANSVFAAHDFCPMSTLSFANDNLFDAVQIYLRREWEPSYAEAIGAALRTFYLQPLVHWPDLFSLEQASDQKLWRLTNAFFGEGKEKPIVLHFDGSKKVEETIKAIQILSNEGFVPCLENTVGVEDRTLSRTYIERYIEVLLKSPGARAVIDVPRLWCNKNGPVEEALSRLAFILGALSGKDSPIILHLIDAKDESQERESWCPLGQGIIPWADVGATFEAAGVKVDMAILEYENTASAKDSFFFLEQWCKDYL